MLLLVLRAYTCSTGPYVQQRTCSACARSISKNLSARFMMPSEAALYTARLSFTTQEQDVYREVVAVWQWWCGSAGAAAVAVQCSRLN